MELHSCIHFLLSAAQHTVFTYLSEQLAPYDVTPAQYGVLNCLWHNEELTPKQISELLYLEASSVSSVLDRMQKKGLVDRNIDPDNRRTILVTATKKGIDLKEPIEEIIEKMNEAVLGRYTPEQQTFLRSALMEIAEQNISEQAEQKDQQAV